MLPGDHTARILFATFECTTAFGGDLPGVNASSASTRAMDISNPRTTPKPAPSSRCTNDSPATFINRPSTRPTIAPRISTPQNTIRKPQKLETPGDLTNGCRNDPAVP